MIDVDPFAEARPPRRAADQARAQAVHDAWAAVVAALRPVAASVTMLADEEIARPSWRPGETIEDAAWREGRKMVWRELLRRMDERGDEA